MQKLAWFFGVMILAGSLSAENLIFNPSFDMTPWDSGWTITLKSGNGTTEEVVSDTSNYYSFPRSAGLYVHAYGRSSRATASLSQGIRPVTNCTCKVYFKDDIFCYWGWGEATIYIKMDGAWNKEWMSIEIDSVWTKWEKVYNSSDTIRGIKFSVYADAPESPTVAWGAVAFWIDDVYISGKEVVIEEKSSIAIAQNDKLEAYPNPFTNNTVIRYSLNENRKDLQLTIHDISGRIIHKIPINDSKFTNSEIKWDGNDENGKVLPRGIYFAKLTGKEQKRNLKLVKIY